MCLNFFESNLYNSSLLGGLRVFRKIKNEPNSLLIFLNSLALCMMASTFLLFFITWGSFSNALALALDNLWISNLQKPSLYFFQCFRIEPQLSPACKRQRHRISKYFWSDFGLLPGLQSFLSSFL